MAWLLYAMGASVLWGLGYALSERVLKDSLPVSFFVLLEGLVGVAIYLMICLYAGTLKTGFEAVQANPKILLTVTFISTITMLGIFFIYMAILGKNASMANLIEITYPLFTILFAWLLFRDVQVNWATALGGLLIFTGIGIIYLKS